MRRRVIALPVLVLATVAFGLAQEPARPTFRSNTRLVQVNVVVHDRSGNPVGDLVAADFKLFEGGKEQPIELFAIETHQALAEARLAVPPNTFSNHLEGVAGGTVTVLLFDRLNTRFEDQKPAKDQIIKVLAGLQPSDRVALYVLESDTVRVLHDFTNDARGLVRVLTRYLGGPTSRELELSEAAAPELARTGLAALDAEAEAWAKQTTESINALYTRRRGEYTSDALEAIANRLAGVRGRKNLIWVSSAFPLVIYDMMGPRSLSPEVSRATRAINNANIAVYPVDTRGLIGAFTGPPPGPGKPAQFTTLGTVMPNMDTMKTIAEDTGGRAYVNTNAIGDAVRRAMDDSRVTYVLGYYPSHGNWDGKFREIKVELNRKGLEVRHRRGYLAIPPQPQQTASGRAAELGDAIRNPLEATGIGLTASLDRSRAPSREAVLTIQVDARSITWDRRGDEWTGALDVVVGQSDTQANFFKSMDTVVNLGVNAERYAQMMA
jgi:VWFA-related protein